MRVAFVGERGQDSPIVGVGFNSVFHELCEIRKSQQVLVKAVLKAIDRGEKLEAKMVELLDRGNEILSASNNVIEKGEKLREALDRRAGPA